MIIIAMFTITQEILGAAHLRIPFREDYDSKFIFELEQFDDEKLLDCTGEVYVRNLTTQLLFNFRNLEIHRNINVKRSRVKAAAAVPIIMKVGDNKIYDPKDYDDYDWIDPRIIVKIMKYTNFDNKGRVTEESWEVSDLECPPRNNLTHIDQNCLKMELKYELEDCIDPVEDEVVQDHHRIIKLIIDKRYQLITKIDYHYQKTNKDFDRQNNAQIVFQEFVRY